MSGTSRYEIDIIANNKAAKALSKTNRQLQKIDKNAKKSNGSFKKMAGLAAGVAAAFGGMKLAASFLDTAKQFENLGVQLKFITGNAKDGAAALGIVEAAAAKSAFAMSDMADAAPLLLTVGSVDQLGDSLDMVGDIAAATGLDFRTVAEQIQRAFSGGIASADIFREKGIKSMLGFQEGVQYSAAETEKHIRDAFKNSTTSLKGATEEMAKTWTGQMSMMGDKWDQFKIKVMESGLFPTLKKHLGDLNKWFEDNKERIDEFAVALGEGLAEAVIKIGKGIKFIAEHSEAFATAGKIIVELALAKWLYGVAAAAYTLGTRLMFATAMVPGGIASIGISLAALAVSIGVVNYTLGETGEALDADELALKIKSIKKEIGKLTDTNNTFNESLQNVDIVPLQDLTVSLDDGEDAFNRFGIKVKEIPEASTGLVDAMNLNSKVIIQLKEDLELLEEQLVKTLADTAGDGTSWAAGAKQTADAYGTVATEVDEVTKSYRNLNAAVNDFQVTSNLSFFESLQTKVHDVTEEMAKSFIPAITTSVEMLSFMARSVHDMIHPTEIMAQTFYKSSTEMLSHNAPAVKVYADNWVHATDIMGAAHDAAVALKNELAEQAESIQQLTDKYDPLGASMRDHLADIKEVNRMYKDDEITLIKRNELLGLIAKSQGKLNDRIKGTSKALKEHTKDMTTDLDKFAESVNKDFNRKLADGLANGTLGFQTFAGMWRKILADLINDTLNGGTILKDILSWLGDLFGGSKGGAFDWGQMLGGGPAGGPIPLNASGYANPITGPVGMTIPLMAAGGTLGAGKHGIAGEAGPELITGPATVTPMADLGSKPNVNITIQAIDTQTGTEFLLKNKKQIEGIIQNAYNRRGKQGIY